MKRILQIFPHCHIVKGYSRSVILDTFRNEWHLIPPSLADLIPYIDGKDYDNIVSKKADNEKGRISEYIDFLLKNDIARLSSVALPYKQVEMKFEYPAEISNMIMANKHLSKKLIFQINGIQCDNIQIYCTKELSIEQLRNKLHLFDNSIVQNIEVIIPFVEEFLSPTIWENVFDDIKRLQKVVVLNAPENKRIFADTMRYNSIVFVTESFSYNICGEVHPLHFVTNLPFFTEAQCHNTCLNRKVCIDAEGNIKNCPVMAKSYGNIRDTTLEEAINKPGFKDLWFINKDKIDVCKDCEFRYMCTDCRAFIKDPENIYSQPAKCTYNPYICLWEGQEGYVPVEKCGTYGRETGFVPDKKRIKELNRKIWGDE